MKSVHTIIFRAGIKLEKYAELANQLQDAGHLDAMIIVDNFIRKRAKPYLKEYEKASLELEMEKEVEEEVEEEDENDDEKDDEKDGKETKKKKITLSFD